MNASWIIYVISFLLLVCSSGILYMLWTNRLDSTKTAPVGSYLIDGTWKPYTAFLLSAVTAIGSLASMVVVFMSSKQPGKRFL